MFRNLMCVRPEKEDREEVMHDMTCKVVVVGDGTVGKTSLLTRFVTGEFDERYQPTIFENQAKAVQVDKKRVLLNLFDTAGQEMYDHLRPVMYPQSDVILICFAVDDPSTLRNVLEKWQPEVQTQLPKVPILLLGLKTDLRKENGNQKRSSESETDVFKSSSESGETNSSEISIANRSSQSNAPKSSSEISISERSSESSARKSSSEMDDVNKCSETVDVKPSSETESVKRSSEIDDTKKSSDTNEVTRRSEQGPVKKSLDTDAVKRTSQIEDGSLDPTRRSSQTKDRNSDPAKRTLQAEDQSSNYSKRNSQNQDRSSDPTKRTSHTEEGTSNSSKRSSKGHVVRRPHTHVFKRRSRASCSKHSLSSADSTSPTEDDFANGNVFREELWTQSSINYSTGHKMAAIIDAKCYFECSSKLNEGVEAIFQHTARVALAYRRRSSVRRLLPFIP